MKKGTIAPDFSCFQGLKWRLELDLPGIQFPKLANALGKLGFQSCYPVLFPSVLGYRDDSGHELVMVPRSGRVQLRVHYTVPRKLRKRVAEEIAGRVFKAADDLPP